VALVCHPDAMTPDGNPLLGPMPGVPGFWMAAGLSLNGFGGAGGMGKTAAELITAGETEVDVQGYRPWRFGAAYHDQHFATAAAREVYKYYYRLRYPLDTDEWGRPQRLSPLHGRLQELGAVFGTKNGWERADYFRPGQPWRRAGADQRGFGWGAPPYLDLLAEEHRAFRERVGIIDMTSFGKIEVSGPDALPLLERVADNRIDRPVGGVVYTQFLDDRGGIVADVTVTRLADERFRVVTGAGLVDSDRGWLELSKRDAEDVEIRDVTDDLAVIGMWGPASREVLQEVADGDVSGEALPFRRAKNISIGGAFVLAQRITYVGELGFELYVERAWAVQVWDRLVAAGEPHGIRAGGYRVLESLRLEKGYRYFGTDLTSGDSPLDAGLDFCVAWDKDFRGRAALEGRKPERRLRTLLVGNERYETVYGGEAIHAGESVVGRVRSAGYGFSVGRNIALGYVPAELDEGAQVGIEVFGELVSAQVAPDTLYDPADERVRA
jgi:glycine cleavage system aminomethyltransferase T